MTGSISYDSESAASVDAGDSQNSRRADRDGGEEEESSEFESSEEESSEYGSSEQESSEEGSDGEDEESSEYESSEEDSSEEESDSEDEDSEGMVTFLDCEYCSRMLGFYNIFYCPHCGMPN